MSSFTLFHYWRSSCSWRVRWALGLKKIEYTPIAVSLLDDSTDSPDYLARNPMGYLPSLEISGEMTQPDGSKRLLAESLPIIEWLDETYPETPLHPRGQSPEARLLRARGRQLAEIVNAGTQPLQNLSVLHAYSSEANEQKKWCQRWIRKGLAAYEGVLKQIDHETGRARSAKAPWSLYDHVTLADLCLIPQVYNAVRFEIPLGEFPLCESIWTHALETHECRAAHPDRFQPA